MRNSNSILIELLQDPSFIAWLNGNGTPGDDERWKAWVFEDRGRRLIVEKARKFINMPFNEKYLEYNDILDELQKLKNQPSDTHLKILNG